MLQVPSVPKEDRIPEEISLAPHKEVSRTIVAKHPDQAAKTQTGSRPQGGGQGGARPQGNNQGGSRPQGATTKAAHVHRASRVEPEADSQALITTTVTARTAVPETTITIVQTPSVLMTTTVKVDSVATIAVERTTVAGINIISDRLVRKSTTRRRKLSSVAT